MRTFGIVAALALAGAALVAGLVGHRQATAPVHLAVPADAPEGAAATPDPGVLRVCADPNNLPFSNRAGAGLENEIAALVARDLAKRVEYHWQPQRRGFIRTTLRAGLCDVVMGVPSAFELVRTTRPYYRSTYVFLSRHDRQLGLRSLDDPRLARLRIGVQLTGEDYENPPPVQALASRHIVDNVRGYLVYGDYSRPDPPRGIVDAVAGGEVDVAIAWGPLAGYFARREPVALDLVPVSPEIDPPFLPFVFDIAMGVRREDRELAAALDEVIERRGADIRAILQRYGVPLLNGPAPGEGVIVS